MDVEQRKGEAAAAAAASRTGVVVAGSVWESRMKLDEVKGGIRVFNDEENVNDSEEIDDNYAIVPVEVVDKKVNSRPKQSPVGASGKRKTWKSESLEGSRIQIARKRSEIGKNLNEQCKELSMSADGIKKSPIQNKKTRSEESERSPVHPMKNSTQLRKLKSESIKASNENESEKIPELRKVKSESIKVLPDDKNSLQLVKAKSVSTKNADENGKSSEGFSNGIEKSNPVGIIKKTRSDEDVDVCEEKVITTNSTVKSPPKVADIDDYDDADGDEDDWDGELDETEVEIEKKSVVVKEILLQHRNERPISIPSIVKKQSPPPNVPSIATKPTNESFGIPRRTHRKLQSFVDLVMWRDVSRSAFVFGIGTFVILSSSYTKDLNISIISVLSYLGLVYLAAIFLFRSFISRGDVDSDESRRGYVFGEEEAVWFVNLLLPYVNEFLVNIKALFSGDPLTTMKMAVLLFILARCGSSITVWKLAKLGFFGVFTVPKICSSYSTQLSAYGTFWIRRFEDAWESCSHKKAVAFGIFTLVWNLSSVVARIWAVFMLFVAFRYFQPSFGTDKWAASEAGQTRTGNSAQPGQIGAHSITRQRRRPISMDLGKQKKPL